MTAPPPATDREPISGLRLIDPLSDPSNGLVTNVASALLVLVLVLLIRKSAVLATPVVAHVAGVVSLTGIVSVAVDRSPKQVDPAIAGKIVLLRHLTTAATHLTVEGSLGSVFVHHSGADGQGPARADPVKPTSDGSVRSVV